MDATLIAIAVAGGAAMIRELRKVAERSRARRTIAAHPELAPGLAESTVVRVTGVVCELETALTSPLASKRCVAYRARGSGRQSDAIGLVRRERAELVPFAIERADGSRIRVEGTRAELDLPEVRWRDKPRAAEQKFLLELGFKTTNGGRFEEVVVEPGQRISVVGLLMFELDAAPAGDAERGFRDVAPPAMRLVGNAEHPIALGLPV